MSATEAVKTQAEGEPEVKFEVSTSRQFVSLARRAKNQSQLHHLPGR